MKKFLAFILLVVGGCSAVAFAAGYPVGPVNGGTGAFQNQFVPPGCSGANCTPVLVGVYVAPGPPANTPTNTPTAVFTPLGTSPTFTATSTPTLTATTVIPSVNVANTPSVNVANPLATPNATISIAGYASAANQVFSMTPGMNTSNRATTIDTNIQSVATAVQNNLALNQLKASMTPTTTPVLVRITYFKFTTSSSGTPTPIATAVASTFHHTQYFFSNTGTTGDSFTVYNGSVSFPTFLAPQACLIRSFVDTASNVAISIGGPVSQAGCTIEGYGLLDAQPYQVPINLTAP